MKVNQATEHRRMTTTKIYQEHQTKQALKQLLKAKNMRYRRAEQNKSSGATNSHSRNISMQEARQRHCAQEGGGHCHVCACVCVCVCVCTLSVVHHTHLGRPSTEAPTKLSGDSATRQHMIRRWGLHLQESFLVVVLLSEFLSHVGPVLFMLSTTSALNKFYTGLGFI